MEESNGWIKLSRKILQSKYYLGEKFTKAMCWIDLLLLAEWRKERKFFVRGIEVVVSRGQVAIGLIDLHKRWNLSVNTVRCRLNEMVKDGRIIVSSNNVVTKITIINWDKYQGSDAEQIIEVVNEISKGVETNIEKDEQTPIPPSGQQNTEPQPVLVDKPKKPEVDCDFVLRLYHHHCPSLPKVLKLSDKRKMKIRVRFEEMGYDYEVLQRVFDKAEASRFMRGDNNRGWSADFDWIFTNGTNWVKILEGKYDNKDQIQNTIPIIKNNGNEITLPNRTDGGTNAVPATSIERQKLSVLATLAKIEAEQ